MLRGYEIAALGRTSSRSEGTLIVGGRPQFGVRRIRDGVWTFTPPESLALAWAARRLWSFRCTLREGESGVCYEDYVWVVERYKLDRLAAGELNVELGWRHQVQTRPRGTPHQLAFVSGTARRIVQLRYTETDFPGSVFLALGENDIVAEFEKRDDALAHLGLARKTDARAAPEPPLTTPVTQATEALASVLAAPDDDEDRRLYASTIGGERGEYITLSLVKKPSRSERSRMKELLTRRRAEWSKPLGINLSGQRWARGFVTRALASTSATRTELAHPEWGLVEEIPSNSMLPPPDLMNVLIFLGGFNTASWLLKRRSPWTVLRRLMVRLAEAELIMSDRGRFPALQEVELYVDPDDLSSAPVSALATHLRSFALIGPTPKGGLTAIIDQFAQSSLHTLTYAPDQHRNGGIELTRGEDGAFRAVRELPRTNALSMRRWLSELPHKSFDQITSKLTPAECEPWLREA